MKHIAWRSDGNTNREHDWQCKDIDHDVLLEAVSSSCAGGEVFQIYADQGKVDEGAPGQLRNVKMLRLNPRKWDR